MSAIYRLTYRPSTGGEHTLDIDLEGERLVEAAVILRSRARELVLRTHARETGADALALTEDEIQCEVDDAVTVANA